MFSAMLAQNSTWPNIHVANRICYISFVSLANTFQVLTIFVAATYHVAGFSDEE